MTVGAAATRAGAATTAEVMVAMTAAAATTGVATAAVATAATATTTPATPTTAAATAAMAATMRAAAATAPTAAAAATAGPPPTAAAAAAMALAAAAATARKGVPRAATPARHAAGPTSAAERTALCSPLGRLCEWLRVMLTERAPRAPLCKQRCSPLGRAVAERRSSPPLGRWRWLTEWLGVTLQPPRCVEAGPGLWLLRRRGACLLACSVGRLLLSAVVRAPWRSDCV
ncbi:hypothetical protein COO60DRAFT_163510 [Scenedesmus sp. NREL 46B-D3]|nr:hypothetical protein COO60DRAFT_163510 [Scenedesmus sp. NREL 46B-D3]